MDIAKSRNFLLKENAELDEMAKIQGGLKDAIEKVIADNPDLNGLPLKKVIRANAEVLDALDGDDLFDNQLNKFIATTKGERPKMTKGRVPGEKKEKEEIEKKPSGPRGRKPGGSTDAKQDIETEIPSQSKLPQNIGPEPEEEEDDEIIDTWNAPEEDDETEKEPSTRDIKAVSVKGIAPQGVDVDKANAFKNIIVSKVNKIEALDPRERGNSIDMQALKKFIKKPEVIKALTVPAIRDLVSSIIG